MGYYKTWIAADYNRLPPPGYHGLPSKCHGLPLLLSDCLDSEFGMDSLIIASISSGLLPGCLDYYSQTAFNKLPRYMDL